MTDKDNAAILIEVRNNKMTIISEGDEAAMTGMLVSALRRRPDLKDIFENAVINFLARTTLLYMRKNKDN